MHQSIRLTIVTTVLATTAILATLACRALLPEPSFERWWMAELGLLELGTAVLLLPAIGAGVSLLRGYRQLPHRALLLWYALFTLGCVYFAGEELSWGQHLFAWQTPQLLANLNDQGETNFHNTSSWLDQKPRLLLELWLLVGGLIASRRLIAKTRFLRHRIGHWLWPWPPAGMLALLGIVSRLPERIATWSKWEPPYLLTFRLSELQEFLFAAALALYLWQAAHESRATDTAR